MSTAPTTSIVILTRNGIDLTRACIESIERCTPEPYELVMVDNGSSDGTLEWLRTLRGEVVVIENDANLGFGAGCNQGIAASSGERILLLNNDVVVTPGWLGALHRELDADPAVGIVGPRSNRVAGSQLVAEPGYDVATLDGLDEWAATWCAQHAGETTNVVRVIGFCMLIERAVIERIGGFDLRFGLGNFEDDDICLRAAVAGWSLRIVHDSFIHHVGSQTFQGEGIDYMASMGEGLARFAAKWRIGADEFDARTGAYRADTVIARTEFDAAAHRSPLVAAVDDCERVVLGDAARTTRLLVACDRIEPAQTQAALAETLRALGPTDDVTVVVRIDPRDADAYVALDVAADAIGDAALPDIELLETRDENDLPALRACTHVLAYGRRADALRALALDAGITAVDAPVFSPAAAAAARSAAA